MDLRTNLLRFWRELAAKAAQEDDPQKLNELTDELLRVLDEQKRQADRFHTSA
jgi:hypothetical protein